MATVQLTPETHAALQERKQAEGAPSLDAVVRGLLAPRPRKDAVIARLRLVAPALEDLGVRGLRLFGTVAADAARPGSDIDLIVDLAEGRDYADLARLQRFLEAVLGAPCDLVLRDALHPRLAPGILDEAEAIDLA